MRDAIKWIRDALAGRDLVEHMTHYLIRDGFAYATNGRLTAGHPFPYDGEPMLVPGESLEKVLSAVPPGRDIELSRDSSFLYVKAGRFKSKLRLIDPDLWPYESLVEKPGAWSAAPIPTGLLDAIEAVRPFISDNATQPWATCVGLVNGWAIATNNVSIGARRYTDTPEQENILLPVWAVDFLLQRIDGLESWVWGETTVTFLWANGARVRSTLVAGEFPPRALALTADAFGGSLDDDNVRAYAEESLITVTPEFRATYLRVASLTEGAEIAFYPDRIEGGKAEILRVEDEAQLVVPEGQECSVFDPNILTPVLKVAAMWDPSTWPNPAPFLTDDGLRGIVLGRRPS